MTGIRERRLAYKTGVPNLISSPFNLLNVGVNVSYTLDVFGGIRRQVEAVLSSLSTAIHRGFG
jgi:hypothetical protein